MLLPLVQHITNVVTSSQSVLKVPVDAQGHALAGRGPKFFVLPSLYRDDDKSFLPAFWMARRSPIQSEANVEITNVTVRQIEELAFQGRSVGAHVNNTIVPLMTNTVAIRAGGELVLFLDKEKKESKKKIDWKDDFGKKSR